MTAQLLVGSRFARGQTVALLMREPHAVHAFIDAQTWMIDHYSRTYERWHQKCGSSAKL
jgi:hypothetical protein